MVDAQDTDDVEQRNIDPVPETAEYDLVEIVAELEGVAMDELPSLYTQVDHFVSTLFEEPPAAEARMDISFSYAGYRVTVSQDGRVSLVETSQSADDGSVG